MRSPPKNYYDVMGEGMKGGMPGLTGVQYCMNLHRHWGKG